MGLPGGVDTPEPQPGPPSRRHRRPARRAGALAVAVAVAVLALALLEAGDRSREPTAPKGLHTGEEERGPGQPAPDEPRQEGPRQEEPQQDEPRTGEGTALATTPPPAVETRPAHLWPFSSESIWNMPIGSGATFADPGFYQPPNGYGSDSNPIIMSPSSPPRPVHTHPWPARCHRPGDRSSGVSIPVPDDYVVAPDDGEWSGRTPNLSGGALLADGRTIREFNYFSRCTPAGPASVATDGLRSTHDIRGDGRPDSFFGGHGGSGLSGVGGTIRRGELTGPGPIRHVTKLTVDMTRWGTRKRGRNAHRWPAYAADSDTSGQTYGINAHGYTPILEMGSLLAIPGTVDLGRLELETGPARKLAAAWQDYGAYVVDNSGFDTGFGQNLINIEHGVRAEMAAAGIEMLTYATEGWADTAWNRDMNRLFAQLRLVTNNGPTTVGGGGAPRAPLAPPLAP